MNKKNNRLVLVFIFLFIISFSLINIYFFYKKEYKENLLFKQNNDSLNAGNLYKFYIAATPNIDNGIYYGSQNASITLISFLDMESEASRRFINNIFPKLDEEFIKAGKLKFYNKYYVTKKDFNEKNNKFLYAAYFICIKSIKKEAYYPLYFETFKLNGIEKISELLEKYKIHKQMLDKCLQENSFDEIKLDLLEVENFGVAGILPRFYIGINGVDNTIFDGMPKYFKFNTTIRRYGFLIGN